MAKIKYTATDALGQVHTRSSARVYTHMVVTRPSYEAALAEANLRDFGPHATSALHTCLQFTIVELHKRIDALEDELRGAKVAKFHIGLEVGDHG